jgi:outer membrane protein OmpA-like peptidoglycan-associated protein
VVKIDNIYYDVDKSNIRPDAALELDKTVLILNKYPTMQIELRSHTDCRAPNDYNLNLSQRRAESAVAYLVSKGIKANRLQAKGYGETLLTNKCADGVPCTEEEHQSNRRTEFKIKGI